MEYLLVLLSALALVAVVSYLRDLTAKGTTLPDDTSRSSEPKPASLPDLQQFLKKQRITRERLWEQGDYLSVTRLNMYLNCPFQYYLRYVKDIKPPDTAPQQVGKALHTAIAWIYECKQKACILPPFSKAAEIYEELLWNAGISTSPRATPYFRQKGRLVLRSYMSSLAPQLSPKEVEWGFRIPIGSLNFLGFVDLVTTDGVLVDHKVSFQNPLSIESRIEEAKRQMVAYTWAYRELLGQEKGVEIHFLFPDEARVIPVSVTDEAIDRIRHTFSEVAARLSHPSELFAPRSGRHCAWCPYKKYCVNVPNPTKGTAHGLSRTLVSANGRQDNARSWANPPVGLRRPGGPRSRSKSFS